MSKISLQQDLSLLAKDPDAYANLTDYKFCAVLYPDATNYVYPIETILETLYLCADEFYYILHDRDLNTDGSPKKPHYHLVLTKSTANGYASPSKIRIVAKQLGIPFNYVQRCNSLKGSIIYLTHEEESDKVVYSRDEIICSDPQKLARYFSGIDDTDMAKEIVTFIISSHCNSVSQCASWALEQGYYSAFRRGFAIFNSIIREQS